MSWATLKRAACIGLLSVVAVPACTRPVPATAPPNVLLIVIDTLRADRVGCYGAERDTTPAIDELASQSVRFERAYASAPWTIPSVASMISGQFPGRHSMTSFDRRLPDEVDTLAEILKRQGYSTSGVVSHIAIDTRHNFQQGFDTYLESEAQGHDHISTPGVTAQAIEQLDELSQADAPFLLFVHYFDPHYNYKRHPEFGFAADASPGRLTGDEPMRELERMASDITPDEAGYLRDVYDEEVRFTDAGIGRLLDRLDALGRAEDTVVVLTADHGEEFLDHGDLGHTSTLYEELVRVPLVVRVPGNGPTQSVVDTPVSLVGLTPTLLDLLGLEAEGASFQAESFAPLVSGAGSHDDGLLLCEVDFVPVRKSRSFGVVHKKAVVDVRYKLIRDDPTGRLELYDLESDPHEHRDLASEQPDLVADYAERLEELLDFAASGALEPQPRSVSPEEIERLKSLGYVGD